MQVVVTEISGGFSRFIVNRRVQILWKNDFSAADFALCADVKQAPQEYP